MRISQPVVNVGTIGHVDHGKSTIVQALSGKWPDTHSEEVKRGITIKLGYADVSVRRCESCGKYTTREKCGTCGGAALEARKISLVDSPGHETLMATVIAASAIMDGALFVIAANEKCPQPQTQEHLMVLESAGIKRVVIAQNKVDLVTPQAAREHYKQIRAFLADSPFPNAPIVPTAANTSVNTDALLAAIESEIPTPERDTTANPNFLVARSFDVNKPGADWSKLSGGVVGGSLSRGVLSEGDEVEILPGTLKQTAKGKESYEPLRTKVVSLHSGGRRIEQAVPGGLVGVSTQLDPALTKADALAGCVLGKNLPPALTAVTLEYFVLKRVLEAFPPSFTQNEPLVLGVGTATTLGFVEKTKKNTVSLVLKKPVCAERGARAAVLRRSGNRWRLYATAKIV
ncbi:MAG: translation initiation factor IF-2 subunit gamma [Candidatus Norongarragalinales archaeon]